MSQKIFSVSELNRETAALLFDHFLSVLVEGEISNLSIPASGHCYFTLKDAGAQVRCAMFRNHQRRMPVKPENGKQVVVRAQVGLYEPRGDYQLIVEFIEEAGDGALRRAFEALKLKLSEEGLFSAAHKKPLPKLPKAIGVITSPTGAAIRDILTVLRRRFAAVPVIIYPAAVQGENAKFELVRALATANSLKQCDILILARGGGSLEDLWAFNEEIVARAVYASDIPVISGVGHETDVTIADFAADVRAPTPSAAAECATPDLQQWLVKFRDFEARLLNQRQRHFRQLQQKLDWLSGRLHRQHPEQKLVRHRQRLTDLEARLQRVVRQKLTLSSGKIENLDQRCRRCSPALTIRRYEASCAQLDRRLISAIDNRLKLLNRQWRNASQTLNAVSPLATLNRGYALVTVQKTGAIVRSADEIAVGDTVVAQLAKGRIAGRVTEVLADSPFADLIDPS